MSSYFDAATTQLSDLRRAGISCWADEVLAWREQFALDLQLRCQLPPPYSLPPAYADRVYLLLASHMLAPWPQGLPGEPDPPDDESQWRLMTNGVHALHDLFHEIAHASLPCGDAILVYKGIAEEQYEDRIRTLCSSPPPG